MQNYTFILETHVDLSQILSALLENEIIPKVLSNGQVIKQITFESYSFRFISRSTYLEGSNNDLIQQLGLDEKEYIFCTQANHPFYYNEKFKDVYPEFEMYLDFWDTKQDIMRKKVIYENFISKKNHFDFKQELFLHCKSKITILAKACLSFLTLFMNLQKTFQTVFKSEQILHPFTNYFSVSSSTFNSFLLHCLKPHTLYAIYSEFGRSPQTSRFERDLSEYYRHLFPGRYLTNYSHATNKLLLYKEAHPDLYDLQMQTAIFASGCIIHGHIGEKCPLVEKVNAKAKAKAKSQDKLIFGTSFKSKYKLHERKGKLLEKNHKNDEVNPIKDVLIKWQCNWQNNESKGEKQKEFFKFNIMRPLTLLNPRDTVQPGFNECFLLKAVADYFHSIDFLDVVSLYPYCAMQTLMPIGKYIHILGDDLSPETISYENDVYLYKNKPIHGLIHATVISPFFLAVPFLLTKVNNHSVSLLCNFCGQKQLKEPCNHGAKKRSFVGTFCANEISYARKLGYSFIFHELMIFTDVQPILRKFIQVLGFQKLQNSGFPSNIKTLGEKQLFCDHLNRSMGFSEIGLALNVDNIVFNIGNRTLFKKMLNTLCGNFIKNSSRYVDTKFVQTMSEINNILTEGIKIENITIVNEKIAQLTINKKQDERKPNLNTCLTVGAYILSASRIYMHKILFEISRTPGCSLIYIDVDGIILKRPKNISLNIPLGFAFGEMKPNYELAEVKAVCILATKCYSVLIEHSDGKISNEIKVSGLNLSYNINSNNISHKTFEELVDLLLKENYCKVSIPQIRRKKLSDQQIVIQRTNRFFSNRLYAKRFFRDNSYVTYPYGMNERKKNFHVNIHNIFP
jgi:hypothetical protein